MAPRPLHPDDAFRAAARRLVPKGSVSQTAAVANADGGAFVEVVIWVPDEEAERESKRKPNGGA